MTLRFNDSATSLDEATLSRIWEPVLENETPTGARTGLGLAVCREILRRHQGEIDILPEDGTTVVVRLPAIAPKTPTSFALLPDESDSDALEYASVLVVGDEPSLVNSLRRVLRGVKAFSAAASGRIALEQIEEGARPDIILCDLMMSDVSGPELFARVSKTFPELAPRMLFITGGAFTEDTRAFSEAHADRVLLKPISPDQLRDRMRQHLVQTRPQSPEA